ncbi:MAG TPA: hypothetical protein ENI23_01115 [bacterium]|nr:hypothetical protein [bacterium]
MVKYGFELKKVGSLLREARKGKGLELSQIAEIIKVRTEYLKALEMGRYDVFDSDVYLKGFLSKYSKFLGVKEEKALAMYRRERDIQKEEKSIKDATKPKGGPSFILTPSKLVAAIIAGTVIAVLIYIGSQLNEIVKPPTLLVTEPIELSIGEEGTFSTDLENVNISGEVEAGATLTVNGTKVTTNNLQKYQILDLSLEDGQNQFILEAESQFGKKSQIILSVIKEVAATQAEKMEVNITVNENLILTVVSDGEELLNSSVGTGEKLDFEAAETFTLNSSDLGKLTIRINGEEQSVGNVSTSSWELSEGVVKKL